MPAPLSLIPPDEAVRLQTLQHYQVLSMPPDEVFRDLLALAAQVFAVPLTFMALVDAHQVLFPVVHGSPQMLPVPRAQALCSSAILVSHPVAYENLSATPLTGADAPAIQAAMALGNAFYAAAPLRMPDGKNIGVLCLASPEPRSFSAAESDVLEALADVASLAIAIRHLCIATPELGQSQWESVRTRLSDDLRKLGASLAPLPQAPELGAPATPAMLAPVLQGLQELRITLW